MRLNQRRHERREAEPRYADPHEHRQQAAARRMRDRKRRSFRCDQYPLLHNWNYQSFYFMQARK